MSERADLVRWILFRRRQLASRLPGFWASAKSYDTADYIFSTYRRIFLRSCKLGSMTYIAEGTSAGLTDIGAFYSIGPRASLVSFGWHQTDLLSTQAAFYSSRLQAGTTFVKASNGIDNETELHDTKVANDVWIGAGCVVLDGAKIGDGAIITTGAVVTNDVPADAIVGGVPEKVIRYCFDINTMTALLKWCWWKLSHDEIQAIAMQFPGKTQWSSENLEALTSNAYRESDFLVPEKRMAVMV